MKVFTNSRLFNGGKSRSYSIALKSISISPGSVLSRDLFLLFISNFLMIINCNEVFSIESGVNGSIQTLGYPNPYPEKRHCKILLNGNDQHRVIVKFEDFYLYHPYGEHHKKHASSCNGLDTLHVYDGINDTAKILGEYCGGERPLPLMSSGPNLLLWLNKLYIWNGSKRIHSKILLHVQQEVEATFSNSATCKDSIPCPARRCGRFIPQEIVSEGPYFRITFRSNDRLNGLGFSASYKFVTDDQLPEWASYLKSKAVVTVNFAFSLILFWQILMITILNVQFW
ncbi:Tolloid-like protein 2 [Armadillidium nasatum]|uniref:Tolloid-like protein 2 n=1 Tax=Armadillidium nasatum TaxID=96803 RepID=A0A5N5T016_9CRUS|nr:Tolloid-like protein 2 [Armadillidium nasatum]